RVVVLEARRHLGGRTTAFDHRESGERVDNGQHVLLGCYRETRTYLRRLDVEHLVAFQPRLSFTCVDRDGRTSTLACPPWRPPLHLVGGLLRWKALGWRDRRSALGIAGALRSARRAVADWTPLPCVAGETVLRWLTRHGQSRRLIELLWEPLAVAAMNQPIDVADAAPFVRILGHVFTDDPADAGIGLPARPLDEVFGEPARAYLEARGGHVRTDALARVVLARSEEHTSELQSRENLVCRL